MFEAYLYTHHRLTTTHHFLFHENKKNDHAESHSQHNRVCQNHVVGSIAWCGGVLQVNEFLCNFLCEFIVGGYFPNSTNNIFMIIIIYMTNANISISLIYIEVYRINSVFSSCQTLCQPIMWYIGMGWNRMHSLSVQFSSASLFILLSSSAINTLQLSHINIIDIDTHTHISSLSCIENSCFSFFMRL